MGRVVSPLGGREFIAGDRFTIADITALCAIDFARVSGLHIDSDAMPNLTGDAFTAANLTFAALVAPPGYDKWLPPRHTWSTAMHEMVDAIARLPAGQFAMRVYRDHR